LESEATRERGRAGGRGRRGGREEGGTFKAVIFLAFKALKGVEGEQDESKIRSLDGTIRSFKR
jgi:hypothetical protein